MSSLELRPRLPPELERRIFETSALLDRSSIPRLLLVASRVLIWIEPLLYRSLEIGLSGVDGLNVVRAVLAKPTEFISRSLRSLVFGHNFFQYWASLSEDDKLKLSSLIKGRITHVGVAGAVHCMSILEEFSASPLQLSCYLDDLFGYTVFEAVSTTSGLRAVVQHPIFRQLTHFRIFNANPSRTEPILTIARQLPALTHLAMPSYHFGRSININPREQRVKQYLTECRMLQVLVSIEESVSDERPQQVAETVVHDAPEEVVPDIRFVECNVVHWLEDARPGYNFWDKAEALIALRRERVAKNASR
ncbi:hypothetical protein MIND_00197600 [Mycena indigotica]|uniref:Uncharacterized protein n=1 Tax=Mycena indigotica TaxID=2126181 RepID=A0A8H6WEH8_9AGAR|nr:uncharacterized protein MIND_00197600 [Mycena indigotica]KAF7311868.1 hypothetical protein MIND_00197600 [Mycena indigotica]